MAWDGMRWEQAVKSQYPMVYSKGTQEGVDNAGCFLYLSKKGPTTNALIKKTVE